jgi:hypothetical protein
MPSSVIFLAWQNNATGLVYPKMCPMVCSVKKLHHENCETFVPQTSMKWKQFTDFKDCFESLKPQNFDLRILKNYISSWKKLRTSLGKNN